MWLKSWESPKRANHRQGSFHQIVAEFSGALGLDQDYLNFWDISLHFI